MNTLGEQFLQHVDKDLKDWEHAAAFFDGIRTVTMDGQIYSGKDFRRTIPRQGRERVDQLSKLRSELGGA